jgi:CxxC motif-containing protein (DUF1111 family)
MNSIYRSSLNQSPKRAEVLPIQLMNSGLIASIFTILTVTLLAGCGGGGGGVTDSPVAASASVTTAGTSSPASGSVATAGTASPASASSTSTTTFIPTSGSGTGTGTFSPTSASGTGTGTFTPASTEVYTPLAWAKQEPVTQYTLQDGTLVTSVGGRVRDRHARELPDAPNADLYSLFAPHYFERRTHDIKIYDNVSPTNPANRILTLVIRPQWWWYGTNFRQGYIGRRDGDQPGPTAVALYGDNGGVKVLPAFQLLKNQELKTPIANYSALLPDPNANYSVNLGVPPKDGEFVLVKQITSSPPLKRELRVGDLVEFELGIFLAGDQSNPDLGRFNYYSDVMVYQVGTTGSQPWFRGPSSDSNLIPWDSKLIPTEALAGGKMMTLQENTSGEPEMSLLQAGTSIGGGNVQSFVEGRRLFHTSFLDGSHAERGNPTLFNSQSAKAGPSFQQSACIQCHTNNGKSSPTLNSSLNTMAVLIGSSDANGKLIPDSRFGTRLYQGLITNNGKTFDGRQATLKITSYKETVDRYPDGTPYTLQLPQYSLTDLSGKAVAIPTRMSVRTAPQIIGMGLLEAVPESVLATLAAASTKDIDGAVGRLQIVADLKDPSIKRVGRFGWRATNATVEQQTVDALNGDMGVTTTIIPKHICGQGSAGTSCLAADKGPELSDADVELIARYTSLLAVPPSRHFKGQQPTNVSAPTILAQSTATTAAQVQAENMMQDRVAIGAKLFEKARCTACHVPTLNTGGLHRLAELRNQTIRPYTDMLLHDMGPDLADNYPQGVATGQEWRTPPLWGLGLLPAINPNVRYLHDGRARTLEEAILWHGGQGQASRDRFKAMPGDDRQRLIDFLKSL